MLGPWSRSPPSGPGPMRVDDAVISRAIKYSVISWLLLLLRKGVENGEVSCERRSRDRSHQQISRGSYVSHEQVEAKLDSRTESERCGEQINFLSTYATCSPHSQPVNSLDPQNFIPTCILIQRSRVLRSRQVSASTRMFYGP